MSGERGQPESPGKGRRILVADDGAVSRKFLERKLISLGFEVRCAEDGVNALELMRTDLPAVVITDLNMPNLDGLELCRAMRQDSRLSSIPAILTCVNEVSETDRRNAQEAGATTFVMRTPKLQEVVSALLHALAVETP